MLVLLIAAAVCHCQETPYRVLVAEMFFPVPYCKWRIEEMYALSDRFHADILVNRKVLPNNYAKGFPPEYTKLNERFQFSKRYDVLIFDPSFNYLNQFNDPSFDGTLFNKRTPFTYMFRRKEYRSEGQVNFSKYEASSHIFLSDLGHFDKTGIPRERKWVKLFPGGGLWNSHSLRGIPPQIGCVVTQPLVMDWVRKNGLKNEVLFQPFGTFLQKDARMVPKPLKLAPKKVGVCMTHASGDAVLKGEEKFRAAMDYLEKTFPDVRSQMDIYLVGRTNKARPGANSTGMLEQAALDDRLSRGCHPLDALTITRTPAGGPPTDNNPVSQNIGDTWVIDVSSTFTEPIFLFHSRYNEAGFLGINAMNFVYSIDAQMKRFWSSGLAKIGAGGNPIPYTLSLNQADAFTNARILLNILTTQQTNLLPARNILLFIDYPRYITSQQNTNVINAGNSSDIVINNIQLNQNSRQISGLLSSATPQDLWQMSVANGSKQSWYEFSGKAQVYDQAGGNVAGSSQVQTALLNKGC